MTPRTTTATASTTTAGLTTTRTAIVPNGPQPPTLGDVAPGLKRGSSGLEVTAIQQALAEHFPARISGRFDSDTDQQVRHFQKDNQTYGTTFGEQQHETRLRVFMPVTATSAP